MDIWTDRHTNTQKSRKTDRQLDNTIKYQTKAINSFAKQFLKKLQKCLELKKFKLPSINEN